MMKDYTKCIHYSSEITDVDITNGHADIDTFCDYKNKKIIAPCITCMRCEQYHESDKNFYNVKYIEDVK